MRVCCLFSLLVWILLTTSCRGTMQESGLADDESATEIAPPFAEGRAQDLAWQLRLNRGLCAYPGRAPTYCRAADKERIAKESGIEASLLAWINDPATRWVKFSYMTFGNAAIAEALCRRAQDPGFRVEVLLRADFVFPPESASGAYKQLSSCANGRNFEIYPRGSDSWLNHAKIFMAGGDDWVRFTSSSANLSGSGTSLHYDNWLLFETPPRHRLALANACFLDAVKAAGESVHDNLRRLGEQRATLIQERLALEQAGAAADEASKERLRAIERLLAVQQDKGKIIAAQRRCLVDYRFRKDEPLQFLATPLPPEEPPVVDRLGELVGDSQRSIRIAAHKITKLEGNSLPVVDSLIARMRAGVKVQIVFDDDTLLRHLGIAGITGQQVSPQEVEAYRALEAAGAEIRFVDTNESDYVLMHNKFMIFDGQAVFTGAGNFSKASLRGTNSEQFYVIRIPDLVAAYERGWEELWGWALPASSFSAEGQGG